MAGGGLMGEDLPGERQLTTFRDGELRLSDRRLVHRGSGFRRSEMLSVHLQDITSVALCRRLFFHPLLLLIPVGFFLLGLGLAMAGGGEGVYFMGVTVAFVTAPLPWLHRSLALRITAPGHAFKVQVGRRDLAAAQSFVQEVEAARAAARHQVAAVPEAAPTVARFA